MRSITKGPECAELREWKRINASSHHNINYDNLGSAQRTPMLDTLVKEQGGLCAYTMSSVTGQPGNWHAHIEHILPRSIYPGPTSVKWSNLVACIPTGNECCEYGAHRKADYDACSKPFVNPVLGGVAQQFRFRENGEVDGLTLAAEVTAAPSVLNLNHPRLVNDRRAKIRGALGHRPSASRAMQRANELRTANQQGMLEPYCEAVAQILEAYAHKLQKRSKRVARVSRK